MRFSVALICVLVVASGCGPSEPERIERATEKRKPTEWEQRKANKRLLSAWGITHKVQTLTERKANQSKAYDIIRRQVNNFGADVNAMDEDGRTALMFAAGRSVTPEVVQFLIEKGADVNLGSDKPLFFAKTPEMIKLLLENGADLEARNWIGNTPLLHAVRIKPEIVQLLIERGADVNAKDPNGNTPLMVASSKRLPNVVQLLIDKGANVNAKDKKGQSVLMLACLMSSPWIVDLLIDAGADVNAKDKNGRTPLSVCLNETTKQLLIDAGAKE